MTQSHGFTFIELLVSVTIVAVLMATAVVSFSSTNTKARDAKRKADLETIRSALEICRANTGSYPATITGSITCSDGKVVLQVTPTDPKTNLDYGWASGGATSYTLSTTLEYPSATPYSVSNP